MPENPIKKTYYSSSPTSLSMIDSTKPVVEDTEENRQLCRKYCVNCQNYRIHSLEKHQPTELFCSRGQSSATSMKIIGCFCPACELFTKHHLRGGYFCVRR
jgi:hypothetical protein